MVHGGGRPSKHAMPVCASACTTTTPPSLHSAFLLRSRLPLTAPAAAHRRRRRSTTACVVQQGNNASTHNASTALPPMQPEHAALKDGCRYPPPNVAMTLENTAQCQPKHAQPGEGVPPYPCESCNLHASTGARGILVHSAAHTQTSMHDTYSRAVPYALHTALSASPASLLRDGMTLTRANARAHGMAHGWTRSCQTKPPSCPACHAQQHP
jgi:hypothetical protein